MLLIDGSSGEGGGQILRTSLSLAMVTGMPVRIKRIRASRPKPGLMRQHLACVRAAEAVCGAAVSGADIGSTEVTFRPNKIKAGNYSFSVGTAGSTVLIFQTVLPALALADEASNISFQGGTHNDFAPSFDFVLESYLRVLKSLGFNVESELLQHGFYPQGGGQWRVLINPTPSIARLELLEAGNLISREAVVTSGNIPGHVAQRELAEIKKLSGWQGDELREKTVTCLGSGNIVSMRLHHENCTEVIEHVGKVGVSAERVARRVVKDIRRYQAAEVPVGRRLADQLLLPMAIGQGGVFRTLKPSKHTLTNIDVLGQFLEKPFSVTELNRDVWEIQLD